MDLDDDVEVHDRVLLRDRGSDQLGGSSGRSSWRGIKVSRLSGSFFHLTYFFIVTLMHALAFEGEDLGNRLAFNDGTMHRSVVVQRQD